MDARDLETLLAAIAWRLRTRADDATLAPGTLCEIVRECAQDLQRLGQEVQEPAPPQERERRERRHAERDGAMALPQFGRFDCRSHAHL